MTPQQMLDHAQALLNGSREGLAFSRMAHAAAWTFLAAVTKYVQSSPQEKP